MLDILIHNNHLPNKGTARAKPDTQQREILGDLNESLTAKMSMGSFDAPK